MKNRWFLFVFLIVPLLALASGSALLYRVTYILAFLVLFGFLWSRFSTRGLKVSVRCLTPHIQAGQWLEEEVEVRNSSWFPRTMLEVRHVCGLPGHDNRRVVHLLPFKSVSWVHRTQCLRRGRFSFGELSVSAPDPFTLFSFPSAFGQRDSIVVYPATLELTDFLLPSGRVLGEGSERGRTERSGPDASGVREYAFGDSFGHIHWRTTARTGQLMVKDFDREPAGPSGEVWLVLDMQEEIQRGDGAESTTEYGITIAASIAKKYIETNRAVGLICEGEKRYVFPARRGNQQWDMLREALALVEPQGRKPLNEVLGSALENMGTDVTIVLITSAHRETVMAALYLLGEQGARPLVIMLDAASFEGRGGASTDPGWLSGIFVDSYIVRRGQALNSALDSKLRWLSGRYRRADVAQWPQSTLLAKNGRP